MPYATGDAQSRKLSDIFAIVLISPITSSIRVPAPAIRAAFGLSLAESERAAAIVGGETIETYAVRTRRTRNTIRNQLASIFQKTGTERQSQLVALIIHTLRRAL